MQTQKQCPKYMPVVSKMDEFVENFQTAFNPPPRPFFGKYVAIFLEIYDKPVASAQNLKQWNFLDRKWLPAILETKAFPYMNQVYQEYCMNQVLVGIAGFTKPGVIQKQSLPWQEEGGGRADWSSPSSTVKDRATDTNECLLQKWDRQHRRS